MDKTTTNGSDSSNIIASENGKTTTTSCIDRKRKMEAKTATSTESIQRPRGLLKPPPKFTVTYSRLCDGGTQEMSTAVECVREIFPDASIQTTRRQPQEEIGMFNPPVVISVSEAVLLGGGEGETQTAGAVGIAVGVAASSCSATGNNNHQNNVLWSAKQKNLYQKYPKKRRRSIKDIRKTLEAFKLSRQNEQQTVQATPTQSTLTPQATTPNEISDEFSTEQLERSSELATTMTATEKNGSNSSTS
jgi:hypothetical protein